MFDRRRRADHNPASPEASDDAASNGPDHAASNGPDHAASNGPDHAASESRERVGGGEHTRVDYDDHGPAVGNRSREEQQRSDETSVDSREEYDESGPTPAYFDQSSDGQPFEYDESAETDVVAIGGFKWGAVFYGWLVATALSSLIIAIVGVIAVAVGSLAGYTENDVDVNIRSIGLATAIVGSLALIGGFLAGGYVAGRLARFDGMRQGAGVWVLGLVVGLLTVGVGAALGNEFNFAIRVDWPSIDIPQDSFNRGGLITLAIVLIGTLIAALGGGKLGQRFHHRIERSLP